MARSYPIYIQARTDEGGDNSLIATDFALIIPKVGSGPSKSFVLGEIKIVRTNEQYRDRSKNYTVFSMYIDDVLVKQMTWDGKSPQPELSIDLINRDSKER